jgi:hypothetical protein
MRAADYLSNGSIDFSAGMQRPGQASPLMLIRPCGLPSRESQPDRDRAYRTPVLGALNFHP